jgi:hypothetical protein
LPTGFGASGMLILFSLRGFVHIQAVLPEVAGCFLTEVKTFKALAVLAKASPVL